MLLSIGLGKTTCKSYTYISPQLTMTLCSHQVVPTVVDSGGTIVREGNTWIFCHLPDEHQLFKIPLSLLLEYSINTINMGLGRYTFHTSFACHLIVICENKDPVTEVEHNSQWAACSFLNKAAVYLIIEKEVLNRKEWAILKFFFVAHLSAPPRLVHFSPPLLISLITIISMSVWDHGFQSMPPSDSSASPELPTLPLSMRTFLNLYQEYSWEGGEQVNVILIFFPNRY